MIDHCPLCGSSDLTRSIWGDTRCDNCGAEKKAPPPLPDEREQAREHAAIAAEDVAVKDDLDAKQPHERRSGGRL